MITTNANAKVTLMSLVGGASHSISDPMPRTREPVGHQDEQEQRQCQGHDRQTAGPDGALDLLADGLDAGLPRELELAGHALGGMAAQVEAHAHDDHHGGRRRPDGVEVEAVAQHMRADVDVGRQQLDRPDHSSSSSSRAVPRVASPRSGWRSMATTMLASKANWKMASPTMVPKPGWGAT